MYDQKEMQLRIKLTEALESQLFVKTIELPNPFWGLDVHESKPKIWALRVGGLGPAIDTIVGFLMVEGLWPPEKEEND